MLMFSAAEAFGANAGGIILTGGGQDGVEGMGEIIRSGGITLAQDPEYCLCKEMAHSVIAQHRVDKVVTEQNLAAEINALCQH